MSKYVCLNCNKDFKQKTNFINHTIYKKNPCLKKDLYEDNNSKQNNENNVSTINFAKKTNKENKTNCEDILKKLYSDTEKEKIKCNNCNRTFTRKDNLKVHIEKYCKKNKKSSGVSKTKVSMEKYQQIMEQNNKLIKMLNECQEIIKQNNLSKNVLNN